MRRRLALSLAILAVSGCAAEIEATSSVQAQSNPAAEAERSGAGAKPKVNWRPIGMSEKRLRETKRYAERHYGLSTWKLVQPRVVVLHMAVVDSANSVFEIFDPDRPDPESGELPGLCAHYLVGGEGRIDQYVRTGIICRHAAGLNYTSIGIEHTGSEASAVLGDPDQLRSSLDLTSWLVCRFGIRIRNVIGHNESLDSPFYIEHVDSFKGQTHSDWPTAYADRYRHKLRRVTDCRS